MKSLPRAFPLLLLLPQLHWAQEVVQVPNRVRTFYGNSHESIQLTGNRQAFFPISTSSTIEQIQSNIRDNWKSVGNKRPYWVPTREEAEAVVVPSEPSVDSQLTNEIEFQKSDELLIPDEDNYHRRPRNRRPRQHRHRRKKHLQNRLTGCSGTCQNMFTCMFSGQKVDWEAHEECPGMFDSCCTSWGAPRRNKQKSGRSLGLYSPNVQYTDSVIGPDPRDPIFNTIQGSTPALPHDPDVSYYTCGISKNAQRKIMGGLEAGYGQFPWTAHIKIKGPGIDKVCGGTLIDPKWILTAGHCTQYCLSPDCSTEISQSEITYKVILGEYDMLSDEAYAPESYLVTYVFRHPEYRNVMRYRSNGVIESEPRFDVALMLLERPVRPAPNVAPICMPQEPLEPPPGTLATVVGWGRLGREEGAPHSNILQAAAVPILSDYGCAIQTGLGVYSDQLCAGGSYTDTSACPGDSGGGLQIQDDQDRWTLIGIVSNGPSVCGAQPVIFHKVAHTLAWVRQTMHDWTYYSSHEQTP